MELKTHKSRIGGLGSWYFDICEKEYSYFIEQESVYKRESSIEKKLEIDNLIFAAGVKAVIFAALCIEAEINDLAGWQLGDKYFKDHLDGLDIVSKWIVIPRLLSGRELKKSGLAFSSLKKLVRTRNRLTHNKSKNFFPGEIDEIAFQKIEKESEEFRGELHNSYKALVFLSLEIEDLLGANLCIFMRTFNQNMLSSSVPPKNLESLISQWCVLHKSKK